MANPAIKLSPDQYEVAWIAPRTLEFRAAIYMLDHDHEEFEIPQGQKFMYYPGDIAGVNTIVATLGSKQGQLLSSNLAEEIKRIFTKIRIYLLVGIAAGIPSPDRDIRLGDVLLAVGDSSNPAIISYDRGALRDGELQLQHHGYTTFQTANIVVQALERVQLKWQLGKRSFMENYPRIKDKPTGMDQSGYPKTFSDPGQIQDCFYITASSGQPAEKLIARDLRDEKERTQIWTGTIGSGNILMRDARGRNELQQNFDLIGIEMEAVGVLEHVDAGIIRAVSDYADNKKNNDFHPYAAAMAASYAREVVLQFRKASAQTHSISPKGRHELHAETRGSSTTARNDDIENIVEIGDGVSNLNIEHPRPERTQSLTSRLSNTPIPEAQLLTESPTHQPNPDDLQSPEQAHHKLLLDLPVTETIISSVLQGVRVRYLERGPSTSTWRSRLSERWRMIREDSTLLISRSPTYFGHLTTRAFEAYCQVEQSYFSHNVGMSINSDIDVIADFVFSLYSPDNFSSTDFPWLSDIIRIWKRFLAGMHHPSMGQVLAILYMIHLEGTRGSRTKRPACSNVDPYALMPSDLRKITSFPNWVPCLCTRFTKHTSRWFSSQRCSTEWNFMNNKYGMFRGNRRDCMIVVRSREKQRQLESRSREPYISRIRDPEDSTAANEALEAMRKDWIDGSN